jgi:DNA-binding CsgD family transcriptional regulator
MSDGEWRSVTRLLRLSGRELEIVQLLFEDLKESVIAGRLGISSHTVHTHLERLYRKLGVTGRCSVLLRVFDAYRQVQPHHRGRDTHQGAASHE